MADRPILFSAPMVRALLAGTKTQTRRALNPQPHLIGTTGSYVGKDGKGHKLRIAVGDRLWVRETWAPLTYITHNDPGPQAIIDGGFYRADEGTVDGEVSKWKPSIFMPRHASRITLTVTDVKAKRLQDISEADAKAEGIDAYGGIDPDCSGYLNYANNSHDGYWLAPKASYASLWNHINGPGSWAANPWVVAYSFSVQHGNIDQIAKVAA